MIYGPFDLSGASQANLDFWYWNQSEPGYDYFFWGVAGDLTQPMTATRSPGILVAGSKSP